MDRMNLADVIESVLQSSRHDIGIEHVENRAGIALNIEVIGFIHQVVVQPASTVRRAHFHHGIVEDGLARIISKPGPTQPVEKKSSTGKDERSDSLDLGAREVAPRVSNEKHTGTLQADSAQWSCDLPKRVAPGGQITDQIPQPGSRTPLTMACRGGHLLEICRIQPGEEVPRELSVVEPVQAA